MSNSGVNEVGRMVRFGLVGALTTALYFGLVWGGLELLGLPAGATGLLAACAAIAVNFTLQRRFTFRSRRSVTETLPRYLFVQLVGAGLNAASLAILVDQANLAYLIGQTVGLGLYVSWSFIAQRFWAFGQDSA